MVETVKQLKLKVEEQEKRIKALEDKVGVWKLVLNFNFKNKVFKFLKSKILPVMQWSSLVVQFVNMRTVFFHGKEFLLKIVIDIENGGDIDLKPSYTFYYKTGKVLVLCSCSLSCLLRTQLLLLIFIESVGSAVKVFKKMCVPCGYVIQRYTTYSIS